MKEIVADVYLPEHCDDIGVFVSVKYVCPHCGNAVERTTLEEFSFDSCISVVSICPHCGQSCVVKAK